MRRYLGAFVVLGVFAVLLAFVLLTQNNNSTPTETAVSATPTVSQADKDLQILSLPATEVINQLDIKNITGTTTLKLDNGAWKQTAPKAVDLDSSVISDTLQQVFSLKGTTFIAADKATDLKAFGLDNPPLTVALTTVGSGVKTLQFGSINPATKNYYVKLAGDGRVWAVNSFFVDTINGWLTAPPTPAPTIAATGAPLTPLPSVTPSPTGGAPTTATADTTPPVTTAAATTTAAGTTASGTTVAATTAGATTAAVTTATSTTPAVTTAVPTTAPATTQ